MLSYPTDLSPQEQRTAEMRLRELAEKFAADGTLRSEQWREVFTRTWRHPYVPSFYPELGAPCLLSIDPQRRSEWLAAVYSDQTLITKVVQVPLSPALRPGTYPVYTSSSTLPSLVLTMLQALDVHDGQQVLEIGTGTGYNAALLCERLGSEHVTSVDIDHELVELATERLAANGYTPTVAAVDGAGGYLPDAPYDRIIATCGVPAIPSTWLAQAAPDAVILVDVHGPIGGTLARLTVDAHGVATGRFLPHWAGFMWLRHTADIPPPEPPLWLDGESVESISQLDPTLIQSDGLIGFVTQWHLPDVAWGPATENGATTIARHADIELLYDRPYEDTKKIRVAGRFTVESVSPHRTSRFETEVPASEREGEHSDEEAYLRTVHGNMLAAGVQNGRKAERLLFESLTPFGDPYIQFEGTRRGGGNGTPQRVAVSVGPQYGTVNATWVKDAARAALRGGNNFDVLLICGFGFDAHSSETVNEFAPQGNGDFATVADERQLGRLPVLLVRMNPELAMGEAVLKKTGTANLFTIFGEPDVRIRCAEEGVVVELMGVDVYDPDLLK